MWRSFWTIKYPEKHLLKLFFYRLSLGVLLLLFGFTQPSATYGEGAWMNRKTGG